MFRLLLSRFLFFFFIFLSASSSCLASGEAGNSEKLVSSASSDSVGSLEDRVKFLESRVSLLESALDGTESVIKRYIRDKGTGISGKLSVISSHSVALRSFLALGVFTSFALSLLKTVHFIDWPYLSGFSSFVVSVTLICQLSGISGNVERLDSKLSSDFSSLKETLGGVSGSLSNSRLKRSQKVVSNADPIVVDPVEPGISKKQLALRVVGGALLLLATGAVIAG